MLKIRTTLHIPPDNSSHWKPFHITWPLPSGHKTELNPKYQSNTCKSVSLFPLSSLTAVSSMRSKASLQGTLLVPNTISLLTPLPYGQLQRIDPSMRYSFQLPSRRHRYLNEREQFLLFIKVLFRYLEHSNKPQLRRKAKAIVLECTRRNRFGETAYQPLKNAIELRLRPLVGQELYLSVKTYCDYYGKKKGLVAPALTLDYE